MSVEVDVKGSVDKGFEAVKEVFENNFVQYGEIGAAVCVYHKGKKVVDLWGGYKEPEGNYMWERQTVVPIFSTTKAVAVSCLALCHARGYFSFDDPVAQYWPEFAQKGKEKVSIAMLLAHRAGLSAIDTPLTPQLIRDTQQLDTILAAQKPAWQPGDYQGYHVWNIGWYISALIERIDPKKRRLKAFFNEEILPHLDGDIRIGIESDYPFDNIAILKPFSKLKGLFAMPFSFVFEFFKPWSLSFRSMLNPSFAGSHANFNKHEILELEMGAGGGIASASALASMMAKMYSDSSCAIYVGRETLEAITRYPDMPTRGFTDIVFKQEAFRFHLGFMRPSKEHNFSDYESAFGGFGAGGSFVQYEPDSDTVIAYVMNNMTEAMMNGEREVAIRDAVHKVLRKI